MSPQSQIRPATTSAETARLLVSFELSQSKWVLTIQSPHRAKLSRLIVAAHDKESVLGILTRQREQAEQRIGRPVQIISLYEAGLDGFWLHRWLVDHGIESHVVDPASIPGARRKKTAKTDRIDGEKLVRALAAWLAGDRLACSMVVPPTPEQEDLRRLSRERGELTSERNRLTNRIGGLLANQGIVGFKPLAKGALARLAALRTGDGRALLPQLRQTIERMLQRLAVLKEQIKAVEAARNARLRAGRDATAEARPAEPSMEQQLFQLRGIGLELATTLPAECLYKDFDRGGQVGAFVGLAPVPHASGEVERDQGISKAGNRRLRALLIEAAWLWRRHQPGSALSRWYANKVKGQGSRVRRIAIVALARKLIVALWRYVRFGVIPEGAVLKG
jgi:transposase